MSRGQRARMTGIHRLEEIECFRPADLTNKDAIGPKAQGPHNQFPDSQFAKTRLRSTGLLHRPE
jgi:hypothetical protein